MMMMTKTILFGSILFLLIRRVWAIGPGSNYHLIMEQKALAEAEHEQRMHWLKERMEHPPTVPVSCVAHHVGDWMWANHVVKDGEGPQNYYNKNNDNRRASSDFTYTGLDGQRVPFVYNTTPRRK